MGGFEFLLVDFFEKKKFTLKSLIPYTQINNIINLYIKI